MRIAAITPIYNSVATLPTALASMTAQTRRPDEIWLIDDASPDPAVRAYLEGLGADYEGIPLHVVYQSKNQGAGAARNRALAATACDLVAFLDSDDAWLPTHLAVAEEALQSHPNAAFVASNFTAVAPNSAETFYDCAAIAARRDALNGGDPHIHYFYRGFIGILTVVARREVLVQAGGFNASKRYSLDWELWQAVLAQNPKVTFKILSHNAARYTLNPTGLTSKTWPRLAEREGYLPHFVKAIAKRGNMPWPLLLLRGWLTVQYETATPLLKQRQWGKIVWMLMRAPIVLIRLMTEAYRGVPPRPNFLIPPWLNEA